jgi:hypothetical protein
MTRYAGCEPPAGCATLWPRRRGAGWDAECPRARTGGVEKGALRFLALPDSDEPESGVNVAPFPRPQLLRAASSATPMESGSAVLVATKATASLGFIATPNGRRKTEGTT